MAAPTREEMLKDLAAADKAGDTALATAIAAKIKAQPNMAESAIKGAQQGVSMGFGDEIQGLGEISRRGGVLGKLTMGAIPWVGPAASTIGELSRQGDEADLARIRALPVGEQIKEALFGQKTGQTLSGLVTGQEPEGWGKWYRQGRDKDRAQNAAALAEHPWMYRGGEFAGAALNPLSRLGMAGRGASLGQRMLAGLKSGAAQGAAYGAGGSEADTMGGALADTAVGAAVGGPVGALLPLLGVPARWVAKKASDALRQRAVESGRKALSGIGAPLTARKEIGDEVVQQALDTGAIRPLGTVTGTRDRLLVQREKVGEIYASLIKDLQAAGVEGPNAEMMARSALDKAAAAGKVLDRAGKGEWQALAQDLRDAVDPTPFASKRLGLTQAEEIKRNLQAEARSQYDKLTRSQTPKGKALMDTASFVRQGVEDAVDEQASKAPELAARFIPVKKTLSNTLQALNAAEEGAARAARRAPPSLVPSAVVGGVTGNVGAATLPLLAKMADRRMSSTSAVMANALRKVMQKGVALSPEEQAALAGIIVKDAQQSAPALVPSFAVGDEERK